MTEFYNPPDVVGLRQKSYQKEHFWAMWEDSWLVEPVRSTPQPANGEPIPRKRNLNEAMKRSAAKNKIPLEDLQLLEETCKLKFTNPMSKSSMRKAALETYEVLDSGLDPPKEIKATKISEAQTDALAYWVAKTFQYRPGKSRNSKLLGMPMRDLPFYVRYGSLDQLFGAYKKDTGEHAVGQHTFYATIRATTRTGTVNSGLSYYWVDFVELMKLLVSAVKRLESIEKKLVKAGVALSKEQKEEAEKWRKRSRLQTNFTSLYLRHEFYGDIKKSSRNIYECAHHALGGKCEHDHHAPTYHKLAIALTCHIAFAKAVEMHFCMVKDNDPQLAEEFNSMLRLSKLAGLEILHFTKHTMRGWWCKTVEKEIITGMHGHPEIKALKVDHKNKTLPTKTNEPMSDYFGKHGISDFAAHIFWWGKQDGKPGFFHWYIDIIMQNTTAQETRDILPGLVAFLKEFEHPEFKAIAGETKRAFYMSDNIIVAPELTPFFIRLNDSGSVTVDRFMSGEAQRNKGAIDTHFHFFNVWLGKGVLEGDIDLDSPQNMYKCAT
jgi:hypothetical protein